MFSLINGNWNYKLALQRFPPPTITDCAEIRANLLSEEAACLRDPKRNHRFQLKISITSRRSTTIRYVVNRRRGRMVFYYWTIYVFPDSTPLHPSPYRNNRNPLSIWPRAVCSALIGDWNNCEVVAMLTIRCLCGY